MNKLGNALYEIHHMDMLAAKDQWVNRLHPLVKLVLTIVFLTVTMSFQKYDLTGLLRMGIYPIVLFIVGEISFRDSIRRLRIVLPLVCFVGLFNPIFFRQVIWFDICAKLGIFRQNKQSVVSCARVQILGKAELHAGAEHSAGLISS